jgi:hypothetical protein
MKSSLKEYSRNFYYLVRTALLIHVLSKISATCIFEKFVLANTDYIAVGYQMTGAASPVSNLLTVTVSTLPV